MRKKIKKTQGPKTLDAGNLRLEAGEGSALTIYASGTTYHGVKLVLCRPLNDPGNLAVLQDRDGKELALVSHLDKLDKGSRQVLDLSLRMRALTAKVKSIKSLAHQYGAVYWSVDTDRGPREFVLKGLTEHVRWLSDSRILMTDVDGNRFEIKDMTALDKHSRELLDLVL
jgi:hypothetical protein